jgi:diaminopimelate decarboxylase
MKRITTIGDKNISFLVKKFGTPIFIFSEMELLRSYKQLKDCFSHYYPRVIIAYSFKTNYTPYICRVLKKIGAWAEVTSLLELRIAQKVGYDSKIIFNGPCKTKEEIIEAIKLNSIINVDSLSELEEIINLCKKYRLHSKIGLRVKISPRSKFGLEKEELKLALSLISKTPQVSYTGLHAHLGTQVLSPLLYKKEILTLMNISKRIKESGFSTQFIDIGGGFPLLSAPKSNRILLKSIAKTVGNIVRKKCLQFNLGLPWLILEPGRALVGSSHYLISKVIRLKGVRRKIAILDAGLNILPEAEEYKFEIFTSKLTHSKEEYCIAGPLCMEEDILRKRVRLPRLKEGDLIIIPNTGAYSISLSWQFIKLRPTVIAITSRGRVKIIRKKETIEDVLKYFYL